MRAIYKKINGHNIMVAHCADDMAADDITVYTSNFTFTSYPETTQEVRQYIDAHSMVTLSLYKINEDTNEIQLRTPAEMDDVPGADWATYRVKAGA